MISSTAKYALRAVVFMADRPDQFVTRSEISDATMVPHEYLLKVLNQLATASLVESRRGLNGGYRLCKPAEKITALDVVLAVDTIPRISKCPLGIVDHEQLCPLHQLLDDASHRVEEVFGQTKILDLIPGKHSRTCEFPRLTPVER